MRLLYFGWVRTKTGISEEDLDLPNDIINVKDLIEYLRQRGNGFALAFSDLALIRIAVDQEMASLNTKVAGASEIALFPPMTGG